MQSILPLREIAASLCAIYGMTLYLLSFYYQTTTGLAGHLGLL